MGHIRWPQMTLLGRIVLFLAAFGAAMALQIGIGYYQTKYVLEPLEKRSESIQNISQFLNDVEACMTALENYRWDYGDTASLIETVQESQRRSAARLENIETDLRVVSEDQYLLANAAQTTYWTLCRTLDSIVSELQAGRLRRRNYTTAARSPAVPTCASTRSSFWSGPVSTARMPTSG